jgi:hypothetical protein
VHKIYRPITQKMYCKNLYSILQLNENMDFYLHYYFYYFSSLLSVAKKRRLKRMALGDTSQGEGASNEANVSWGTNQDE